MDAERGRGLADDATLRLASDGRLVQAASAIPVFVAVLPAGALADMVDRRRLLLFTQSWMIVAALALGVLTLFVR